MPRDRTARTEAEREAALLKDLKGWTAEETRSMRERYLSDVTEYNRRVSALRAKIMAWSIALGRDEHGMDLGPGVPNRGRIHDRWIWQDYGRAEILEEARALDRKEAMLERRRKFHLKLDRLFAILEEDKRREWREDLRSESTATTPNATFVQTPVAPESLLGSPSEPPEDHQNLLEQLARMDIGGPRWDMGERR